MGRSASVGRIVLFHEPEHGAFAPAIINGVHAPDCVSVTVFPKGRLPYAREAMPLVLDEPGAEPIDRDVEYARWPDLGAPPVQAPTETEANTALKKEDSADQDDLGDPIGGST